MAGRKEVQRSIEVLSNPLEHITVAKDGTILFDKDIERAFEIAREELQEYDERLASYGW